MQQHKLNPLPNDRFLHMTKLKAFADDKLNVAKMTISLCCRLETTVGKEENAGYQHFLLFQQCFPRLSSLVLLEVRMLWLTRIISHGKIQFGRNKGVLVARWQSLPYRNRNLEDMGLSLTCINVLFFFFVC